MSRLPSCLGAVIAFAALVPAPCAAADAPLEPVTKWNADWSAKSCALSRGFGQADNPDVVVFERFGATENFQLTIVSNTLQSLDRGAPLTLRFGDGEPITVTDYASARTSGGKHVIRIRAISLGGAAARGSTGAVWPTVTPEQEAEITSISIGSGGQKVVIRTGALDKAFAALRGCADDLVKSWGLDPVQQATLSKKLVERGDRVWVTDRDYPRRMLAAGKEGIVNFRLMVDATGKPTSCEVQRSYTEKELDDATCALLLQRVRFHPAIDSQGNAVPSYIVNSVNWVLPR